MNWNSYNPNPYYYTELPNGFNINLIESYSDKTIRYLNKPEWSRSQIETLYNLLNRK